MTGGVISLGNLTDHQLMASSYKIISSQDLEMNGSTFTYSKIFLNSNR